MIKRERLTSGLYMLNTRRKARRPFSWYMKKASTSTTPSLPSESTPPSTSTPTRTPTSTLIETTGSTPVQQNVFSWGSEGDMDTIKNMADLNLTDIAFQLDLINGASGNRRNDSVNTEGFCQGCWMSPNRSLDSMAWDWNMTTVLTDSTNFQSSLELFITLATALVLGLITLATVVGNVFVIAAILLEKNLQNVANYLILSLAVADLLVACLVMPLGAVYEVSRQWTLGPELCDMWTSSDVLCCTASILHLVAIALDRYWAVTNIDYIHQRTAKRIGMMIFIIWCVSFFVCIAPLLGWKDPEWETRVVEQRHCLVSQDIGYQIFATASSFYLPLLVILFLYWKIFLTARKRIRRRNNVAKKVITTGQGATKLPPSSGIVAGLCAAGANGGNGGIAAAVMGVIGQPLPTISELTTTTTTAMTNISSANSSPEKGSFGNGLEYDPPTTTDHLVYNQPNYPTSKRKPKEAADSKRERKAAKTLAIITGAFVICWLPFFVMAILLPICNRYKCHLNKYLFEFFLWLGYFNSTLNPIIYTIFSPEFRHAFKRIICGRRNSFRNRRHFGVRHVH